MNFYNGSNRKFFIFKYTLYATFCLVVATLDKIEIEAIAKLKGWIISATIFLVSTLGSPVVFTKKFVDDLIYFNDFKSEFNRISKENDSLHKLVKRQQEKIFLIEKDSQLVQYSRFVNRTPFLAQISFSNSSIIDHYAIINIGNRQGLTKWKAVVTQRGLAGRVIEVYNNYSKIMLISDIMSSIPVITDKSRYNVLLQGTGIKNKILLTYLPKNHKLQLGERIFTATTITGFPSGIFIGKICEVHKRKAYVCPVVDLNNLNQIAILQ